MLWSASLELTASPTCLRLTSPATAPTSALVSASTLVTFHTFIAYHATVNSHRDCPSSHAYRQPRYSYTWQATSHLSFSVGNSSRTVVQRPASTGATSTKLCDRKPQKQTSSKEDRWNRDWDTSSHTRKEWPEKELKSQRSVLNGTS